MADRTAVVKLTLETSGLQAGASRAAGALDETGRRGKLSAASIGNAFSKIGSTIGGEVGAVVSQVGAQLANIGEHASKASKKMQGLGAAGVGIGAGLMAMGSGDQQAFNQLDAAIQASGHSTSDYKDAIEKTIKAQENFGHGAADTQMALMKLTAATNDPAKALDQMGLVANLAAAKHISLADAAGMVAKVLGGGGAKMLKEYGITLAKTGATAKNVTAAENNRTKALASLGAAQKNLSDLMTIDAGKTKLTIADKIRLRNAHDAVAAAQKKVKDATQILATVTDSAKKATNGSQAALDQLSGKLKGQAAASVDTFSGKLGVLRTKLEDGAAQFGQKYGPAITMVAAAMGIAGTVMEVFRGAAAGAAGAEEGLNLALLANPIVLVVAAILALIAVAVLCYKHFETFRNIVNAAWNGIKTVAMAVWNYYLRPIFKLWVLEVKLVWAAIQFLWQNVVVPAFNNIKSVVKSVWDNVLKPVFGAWKTNITGVWTAIQWLWKNVAVPAFAALGTAVKAADKVIAPIFAAWQWILDKISGAIQAVSGFFSGGGSSATQQYVAGYKGSPYHQAAGGPVTAGRTYMVGERGPETFVPSQSGTIVPNGVGSGSIVIHTHTYMDSRELRTTVQRYKARNGFTGLA